MSCLENSRSSLKEAIKTVERSRLELLPVEGTRPMRDALQALGADLEDLLVHLDRFAGRRVQSDEDRHRAHRRRRAAPQGAD